jgi:hypothetical protein
MTFISWHNCHIASKAPWVDIESDSDERWVWTRYSGHERLKPQF